MNRRSIQRFRTLGSGLVLLLFALFVVFKFLPPAIGGGGGMDCAWTERVPVDQLEYVSHAQCRMACRDIDRALVERVYLHGKVNCEKSGLHEGSPRYALELRDDEGDMIRVIVEDEGEHHVIVTVIRLGQEDRCQCS